MPRESLVFIDQKSIMDLNQIEGTIWAKHNTMEQTSQSDEFGLKGEEILMKKTDNVIKSNKCSQCDFASFQAGNLRRHLKIHSGEKSNKCSQCEYACSDPSSLKRHLKTHSGEKTNKCNQCDYASSRIDSLRTHLKTHSGGCRRFEEAENTQKVKQIQCYFASSHAGNLRRHLKMYGPYYGGEKECN